MEIQAISFPENLDQWDLVAKYMIFRKEMFMDKMDWPLFCSNEGMEFEQYDNLLSVYIVAHKKGVVYGGARLVKTTVSVKNYGAKGYSYMLRDAYLGRLDGLPTNICDEEPPVSNDIWELTRLSSHPQVRVGADILGAANDYLYTQNAKVCLVLARPPLFRMAKSLGYLPKALGKIRGNDNGKFMAFEATVINRDETATDKSKNSPALLTATDKVNKSFEINLGIPVFECFCKSTGKAVGREYRWSTGEVSTVWFSSLDKRSAITKLPITT